MANMKFEWAGTSYTFDTNPSLYNHAVIPKNTIDDAVDGSLLFYQTAKKNHFELQFTNIGTAQMQAFQTAFNANANLTFTPFDESRGTALTYTVRWTNPFDFRFVQTFWDSGYQGMIVLREI